MMTGFDEVRDAKQGAISRLLDPASDGPPAPLDGPIEDAILA